MNIYYACAVCENIPMANSTKLPYGIVLHIVFKYNNEIQITYIIQINLIMHWLYLSNLWCTAMHCVCYSISYF